MARAVNGPEVAATRIGLGLSVAELAEHLGVNPRTVRSWESGRDPVGDWVADAISLLSARADDEVAAHVAAFAARPGVPAVLSIEDDDDAQPLGWQLAIAFRVRQQVPGLRIVPVMSGDE